MKKNIGVLIVSFIVYSIHVLAQSSEEINFGKADTYLNEIHLGLKSNQSRGSKSFFDIKISRDKTVRLHPNINNTAQIKEFTLVGTVDGYTWAYFGLYSLNSELSGYIIIHDTKEAFKFIKNNGGDLVLKPVPIDQMVCVDYATDRPEEQRAKPSAETNKSFRVSALDLQSLPGANGCILLDFDGHFVSGTNWEGGAAINSSSSDMSDAQIQEVWEIISEDFRPFNLNITTNEGVFNSYPKNKRRRCVFTKSNFTDKGSGGAGGVAFPSSFAWNNDDPCYVFMTGGAKAPAEGASHEIGHTLGLSHDGLTNPVKGYYEGQGDWAPIMGVGYYRPVSQWSKGEYNFADQKEDDLQIMSSTKFGLGYRSDVHGNTLNSAFSLNVNSDGTVEAGKNYGIIERSGDVDVFKFESATGGNVSFQVNTVYRHGNLNVWIRIYNSSGTEIANVNPSGLNASWFGNVTAGIYYVSVTGAGAGNPVTDGYSNYGALGSYWISGYVPSPGNAITSSTGLVTVYEDINFTGFSGGLSTGDYNLAKLKSLGVKDNSITSLKVSEGYKAVLYFDDNFTGNSITVTSDQGWIGGTFNDQVTSIQIRTNGLTNLEGTYFVKNAMSSLFMDVNAISTANGASVTHDQYYGGNNQKFKLTHLGDGNYSIIAMHSNKSIDVDGISQNAGAKIVQWDYVNGKNQHFILVDAGNGLVRIIAEHSGKVLMASSNTPAEQLKQDVNNQTNSSWRLISTNNSGVVTLFSDVNYQGFPFELQTGDYTYSQLQKLGMDNNTITSLQVPQGFKAVLYDGDNFTGTSITVTNNNGWVGDFNDKATSIRIRPNGLTNLSGTYYVKNASSGLFIDLDFGKSENGTKVQQYPFNGSDAQKFKFVHLGDGNYSILTVPHNKALDVDGISQTEGAGIVQWDNVNGKNQHFIAVDAGNGLIKLIAEHSAKVLEVSTNNQKEQIHQWWNANQYNSFWKLTSTTAKPTVSILSPTNNATYPTQSDVLLKANVSDSQAELVKMEFYSGNQLIATLTQPPYEFKWKKVPAGHYTVTAKAYNSINNNSVSSPVTIIVSEITALHSSESSSDIKVYPVPATDVVTIQHLSLNGMSITYEVYNTMGVLVKKELLSGNTISVAELEPSMYVLLLFQGDVKTCLKIIKQ